ncbi:MAG: hypothetical protein RSD95_17035 [Clostridia bacterium]
MNCSTIMRGLIVRYGVSRPTQYQLSLHPFAELLFGVHRIEQPLIHADQPAMGAMRAFDDEPGHGARIFDSTVAVGHRPTGLLHNRPKQQPREKKAKKLAIPKGRANFLSNMYV